MEKTYIPQYAGGNLVYREKRDAVAASGYKGFLLEKDCNLLFLSFPIVVYLYFRFIVG